MSTTRAWAPRSVTGLAASSWAPPGSLEAHLLRVLPGDYLCVAEARVHGVPVDAIVVGPQGLFVLHAPGWGAGDEARQTDPARRPKRPDSKPSQRTVRRHAEQARHALRAFLHDEFPGLGAGIHDIVVVTDMDNEWWYSEDANLQAVPMEGIGDAITSTPLDPDDDMLDGELRAALAVALEERGLTATQRASEPFVFRSGGLFGSGKKVWTIQAAVRHMGKHPDDGIHHLRNGTLARWLSEQGAEHLAGLAREVLRTWETDPRVSLETFLIGTGLVRRPRLRLRPGRLNLGCVLTGESRTQRLQLRQGRGRGYLFGAIHTADSWLRVEPRAFSGSPHEVTVTADTTELPISQKPWPSSVEIECSASEEPIEVPVKIRVVGLPAPFNRRILRPAIGFVSAGVLGALIGLALALQGLAVPAVWSSLAPWTIAPGLFWAVSIGLPWAILGGLRGWLQPVSWPTSHALARWLLRALLWGLLLSVAAVAGYWAWGQLGPEPAALPQETSAATVGLVALAFSVLPAVLGEIAAARSAGRSSPAAKRRGTARRLLLAGALAVVVFALLAGALWLSLEWQDLAIDDRLATAEQWLSRQWAGVEEAAEGLADRFFSAYYGRNAPVRLTPAATATPDAGRSSPDAVP